MFVKYITQWFWNHLMDGTNSTVSCTLLVLIGCTLFFSKAIFPLKKIAQWVKCIRNLPPGPWGVPIWGYLPFIKGTTYLHYYELAKKFGGIFSIRLGSVYTVVLSDPRLIREAFKSEEFSGRPHTDFMNILDGYGIVNTEGDLWKNQRKFLHKKLSIFGIRHTNSNKDQSMESRIMREVKAFLVGLKSQKEAPTNLSSFFAVSISNVICSLIMSVRFNYGELRFKRFMNLIDEGFKLFASLTSANYIPLLRYLPGMDNIRNKISQNRAEMAKFFQDVIKEHKDIYNENNIRDIVDDYLYEIQKTKNENGNHYHLFQGKNKDRQMQQILGDLFSAGMETVKNTLEWSIVFMLHYPEAAKAVQEELDQVVGRRRLPTMEDRDFLPITDATIQEILRRSNLVPLGTTHATTREVKFNGYTLPAGSHVIPLLYAVHMNPELWDEPEVFRPSRFLTDEGKVYKPKFFIPFGVGRRKCLGDKLAHMEIFLFFSSLMHMFNLRLPEGASLPTLNGIVGVTISPEPFEVCLQQRSNFETILKDGNEAINNSLPQRNHGSL